MSNDSPKISAFIITKNESAKISDCLLSLKWADEIIVVDDFSTDATPEICRGFGAAFYQHTFSSFRNQKNYAMSLATHEWVLELDADERISDEMRNSILALTADDLNRYDCFAFKRKTRFWGKWIKHSSFYPDYKSRLYCRTRGAWNNASVHERFIPDGNTLKLDGNILHEQDLDLLTYLQRIARYANMSATDYFANGRRAKWHHVSIRPVTTFSHRYFIRLGFLDGVQGFVISVMGALGTFIKYMRLYEIQNKLK
ncbi:MAG: glycosyltransferase family 2 protein [Proteobacteria bacterium]|nr:glycosyltransferase family 2 protein [Pseudomonadota bacterium]